MLIKITVQGGVVQDVETTEPALVQIVELDTKEISTFDTTAQTVEWDTEGHEGEALLNHETRVEPLRMLFVNTPKETP